MDDKLEVQQGTLALMVLKTLQTMGPLHGYGIGRRIEQTSGDRLTINYGTLDRWVRAFKRRRDEIVNRRCPS